MRAFRGRRAVRAVVLLLCALLLASCARPQVASLSGRTMGTSFQVLLVVPGGVWPGARWQAGIEETLQAVDAAMSTWRDDTELSRLNRAAAGRWHEVGPALFTLLEQSLALSAQTGGYFDVTVGPLVNLWGFGPAARAPATPSDTALQAARARVGYAHVTLDAARRAVKKDVDVYIDLSAIAKGYAVDQVAAYLDAQGVEAYLVEIGGELRGRGRKPDGSPWRVGIETPDGGARSVQRALRLEHTAIATSGDYRNYYELRGRRYSHTIDPLQGRPVAHALASVSVVDTSAARADAWATAMLAMGPERAWRFATTQGIAAHFILRTAAGFEERWTPQLAPYLEAAP